MAHAQVQTSAQERTSSQIAKRGFIPALGLFLLAPLVGEFLLGNLPITWLWALLTLAPLYGGGALLIRETTRRLGLGWPSMIIFGLVYAIIEEAFVTQSLFNPNYVGLRLLDYGYIPSLGISAWWTVFVLGIHTIWSTAVPIALVESFTPQRRRTPWLGPWGLAITALIFVIGCVVTFAFQMQSAPFMASNAQFLVSAVIVVILIVIAIALGRIPVNAESGTQAPPSPQVVGGVAFVLGSAFMALANVHEPVPAILTVAGMLGLLIAGSLLVWNWSRRVGWSERHRLAVASGLLLVYVWYAFVQVPSVGDTTPFVDTIGNVVFGIGALILLFVAWRRVSANQLAGG
ncbi:MAG: hypothetical protein IT328_01820 [Caldilineaceae bacterium]|nr:hypothetical protein [Caldilineaceae bacterium]